MSDKVFVPNDLQTIEKTSAPFLMANFLELQNKINGHLGRGNLNFVVPQSSSGSYTGNGTANRVITTSDTNGVAFTPRFVLVFGNNMEFIALGDGNADMTHYQTTSAGARTQSNTDWQGITTNGFKCGSSGTGLSNASGQTYAYVAWR